MPSSRSPQGLAQAFLIGREFIGPDPVVLILGDNIFYGQGFADKLRHAARRRVGATNFAYVVKDPPAMAWSNWMTRAGRGRWKKSPPPRDRIGRHGPLLLRQPGASTWPPTCGLPPAASWRLPTSTASTCTRGELYVEIFGRGFAWLDTGTEVSLLQASEFVRTIEEREGLQIACLEEIAYLKGFISAEQLAVLAASYKNSYGQYLSSLIEAVPKWQKGEWQQL